jgi:hypothetical protein
MAHDSRPALLAGGPLDGQIVTVEDNKDELLVTMADRAVHRYLRTRPEPPSSEGVAAVFTWSGRAKP